MVNIEKFSLGEMFSSPSGKTSMSLFCGLIVIVVGCFCFTWAVVTKSNDAMFHSAGVITLGVGLLGIRRFTKDKQLTDNGKDPLNPEQK